MYLFHDQLAPFFTEEVSLRCMIDNRFGHNCTFKIPEYNYETSQNTGVTSDKIRFINLMSLLK